MQALQSLLHYNLPQYWNIPLKTLCLSQWLHKGDLPAVYGKSQQTVWCALVTFLCPLSPGSWFDLNSLFWQCWALLEEPNKCATIISIFCHIGWFWSGDCDSCRSDFLEFNNMGIDISIFSMTGYHTWFDQ